MARRGRHRKGGRVTPKGTRPLSYRGSDPGGRFERVEPEPDLMRNVRLALSEDHPLAMMELASSLLTVVDERRRGPLDPPEAADDELTREELIGSLIGADLPETSAVLAVVAAMSGNVGERARIRGELEARQDLLPAWIDRLGEADAYRAVEMVHVLGDGDDVMVGVRLAGGEEFSVLVYIDHNLGSLVKDAFVVPLPIDELVEIMRAKTDDPDTVFEPIDLGDARVRISDAIERGAMTVPPLETPTWPLCRPLVEWVTGKLPKGGKGYVRPEWDDESVRSLTERFFSSSFGARLDDADHRALLEEILWFGTDYGPGDPMRWSPVAVEMLLADWIPRKLIADVAFLAKAPELLRALIGFCHHERGIREPLTAETLAAVDDWDPDYQEAIRTPRPQGPEALLVAMGGLDPDGPWPAPFGYDDNDPAYRELMLDQLRRAVGSDEALNALNDDPLPGEVFVWDEIPDDVLDRVAEVLALCDKCCDELLDVEYRTACRRFLHIVASADPNVFRRKARANTSAAAVCWAIGKANDLFQSSGAGLEVKDLMLHFGLSSGGVSQRAGTMLKAGGFPQPIPHEIVLGSPDLLVSSRRRDIMHREKYR